MSVSVEKNQSDNCYQIKCIDKNVYHVERVALSGSSFNFVDVVFQTPRFKNPFRYSNILACELKGQIGNNINLLEISKYLIMPIKLQY